MRVQASWLLLALGVLLSAGTAAAAETSRERAPRLLDEVNIEGQIAVPQVLFITARDQRRLLGFQHRRYLRTSLDMGRQTVTATRIRVVGNPSREKEIHP